MTEQMLNVEDGLEGLAAKTGQPDPRDKGKQVRFHSVDMTLDDYCRVYETDFLAEQTVDLPANDATHAWRKWNAEPEQVAKLRALEDKLLVRDRVGEALILSRALGGGALIIHNGTPAEGLIEPLDPSSIQKGDLKGLVVANRRELIPAQVTDYVQDVEDLHYGLPATWLYTPENTFNQQQVELHHSRIVFFRGRKRLINSGLHEWWWGESVLKSTYEAIQNAKGVRQGSAHLAQEASVDVLKIEGLAAKLATVPGEEAVHKYAGLMRMLKGNLGMMLLDGNDGYERNAYAFAGLNDLLTTTHGLVAAAADIPQTRMLGQSPGGMNSTGGHDMLNYYHSLTAVQEKQIQPAMRALDEMIIRSALGDKPEGVDYEWQLPDMLTEKEKAEVGESRAKIVQTYMLAGTVPSQVLEGVSESAIGESGDLPGGRAAYDEWRDDGEPEDPVDPAVAAMAKVTPPELKTE